MAPRHGVSRLAGVCTADLSLGLRYTPIKTDWTAENTEGRLMHPENLEAPWLFKNQVGCDTSTVSAA